MDTSQAAGGPMMAASPAGNGGTEIMAFKKSEESGGGGASDSPRKNQPTTSPLAEVPAEWGKGFEFDLNQPALYLNREMTWLSFNQRVLREAQDERNPLMERLKFVAIVSGNLDEFFMKRVGGLKQQQGAGMQKLTVDGRTPQQQIQLCQAFVREMERQKHELLQHLREILKEQGIEIVEYKDLTREEQRTLRGYYYENIFPLVTPQAMDPAHPFPFISNLSLNLLITLSYPETPEQTSMARVKVPVGAGIPRLLKVDDSSQRRVTLEDIMAHNLDLLFPGMEVQKSELFRVTRNANTERAEDRAEDLLQMIETELRDRRFAPIVRMEVQPDMDPMHRGMLAAELGLDEVEDVFEVPGMMGMKDLFELVSLGGPELHDPPHQPTDHPKLQDSRNIFHILRESNYILLHHPYESFTTSVERFLREASEDPKVRAIKMTLYRTSRGTKVVDYLVNAARNGKQVAVVIELKARFDEAANIQWANRLEEAGVHVTYGVVGLKTHSKVILVVRQDYNYNQLRRYAHIGTGNYHAGTARLYSDLGLLTCDEKIGADLTELFNYLTTGYTPKRNYQKILPSPKMLKKALLSKIEREIELHTNKTPGLIQFKMNALEDADITRALYQAAQAGVKLDLIIRDTCRLRAGIPGLTDNSRVVSIVGRFLEHTRIYYFRNGGDEEYFIGSADSMQRNLESRVEVVTPVEDPVLRAELRMLLDTQLADKRNLWEMRPDGSYTQLQPEDEKQNQGSQESLIAHYENLYQDAYRLRKRRTPGSKRGKRRNL